MNTRPENQPADRLLTVRAAAERMSIWPTMPGRLQPWSAVRRTGAPRHIATLRCGEERRCGAAIWTQTRTQSGCGPRSWSGQPGKSCSVRRSPRQAAASWAPKHDHPGPARTSVDLRACAWVLDFPRCHGRTGIFQGGSGAPIRTHPSFQVSNSRPDPTLIMAFDRSLPPIRPPSFRCQRRRGSGNPRLV